MKVFVVVTTVIAGDRELFVDVVAIIKNEDKAKKLVIELNKHTYKKDCNWLGNYEEAGYFTRTIE
jgi:hypothetical protein